MIEMMQYTDQRYSLTLMLITTSPSYTKKLHSLACDMKNICFIDPVPMPEIVNNLKEYDVGLYLLEPTSYNTMMALPNKLFEFVQGRLAIAIGPSPEMAGIVRKYDLGIVAKDFDPKTMALLLNSLSPNQIQYFKEQSHKAAYDLSAKKGNEILDRYLEKITKFPQTHLS